MFTTLLCTYHVNDRKLIIAVQSALNRILRVTKVNFTISNFTAIFRACFTIRKDELQLSIVNEHFHTFTAAGFRFMTVSVSSIVTVLPDENDKKATGRR